MALSAADIARAETNVNAVNAWAEGDETTSTAMANGRIVPSPAKVIYNAHLFKTPTAYSAAATYTDATEPVTQGGITYAPQIGQLPIGPEAFDSNKWYVLQGYVSGSGADLDMAGGDLDMAGGDIDNAGVGVFTGKVQIAPSTGTNPASIQFTNTGGNAFFGVDNSAGSNFASSPYATVVYYISGREFIFSDNGTTVAKFEASTGVLDLSSNGVKLGGTAAANLLDDYEEGTFTPEISDTSSPVSKGQTYSAQIGRYTKIGNRVICMVNITMSSIGTLIVGSTANIVGLPFTSEGTGFNNPSAVVRGSGLNLGAVGNNLVFQMNRAQSAGDLWVYDTVGGVTGLQISELSASGSIQLTLIYEV